MAPSVAKQLINTMLDILRLETRAVFEERRCLARDYTAVVGAGSAYRALRGSVE